MQWQLVRELCINTIFLCFIFFYFELFWLKYDYWGAVLCKNEKQVGLGLGMGEGVLTKITEKFHLQISLTNCAKVVQRWSKRKDSKKNTGIDVARSATSMNWILV